MKAKQIKKSLVLAVLFLLPVAFIFMLTLSEDNYNPLDIVKQNVNELPLQENTSIELKEHLTVLAFFGNHPMDKSISALNLKELIYDKFKGFKKFQIVVLVPHKAKNEAQELFREIASYEDLRFWHFVYANENEIKQTFYGLRAHFQLDEDLSSDQVFIIDTDLNQRGRLDDRTDNEIVKNDKVYPLLSYNCIEIAELKNKMGAEDLRVLFTEYRQKRKGIFDSKIQQLKILKQDHE